MFESNRAVKRYFKRHSFSSFELNDRQADLVCKFTLHHDAECPVNADAFVVYRTVTIAPDGREIYSAYSCACKGWSNELGASRIRADT